MKKIAYAVLITVGMSASATALAAGVAIPTTAITPTECALLGENVVLNLSKSVLGAYKCVESTTTISVAACHQSGSRKAKQVQCTGVGTADATTGVYPSYTPSGCSATTPSVTVSNYTGFGGTSQGGSLGTYELGTNCTASSIAGVTLFN